MLQNVFIAAFVVLPLTVALLLILWRIRGFVIAMAAIVLVAMAVWGALRVGDLLTGWGNRRPPPACFDTPSGTLDRCAL
jgi:hypothetical protein